MLKKITILVVCIFLFTACASKMPLNKQSQIRINESSSLVLFGLTTRNEHTKYQLTPYTIVVKRIDPKGKEKTFDSFMFDSSSHEVIPDGTLSFANLLLPPGNYRISRIQGHTELAFFTFLPTRGFYNQDVNLTFSLKPKEILYLGHLEAVLRKKNSLFEESAGPGIPIIDQLHTGISDGSFDFMVQDKFDSDLQRIKERYPILADKKFRKELMNIVN